MARLGLTFYLMLVAAVEPWLCCCSVGQLANLLRPTKPKMVQTQREAGAAACCCHDQKGEETPPVEPTSVPSHSCPCQESRPLAALLSVADVAPGTSCTRLVLLADLIGGPWFLTCASALTEEERVPLSVECGAFPYFSARDILRTLHRLRC